MTQPICRFPVRNPLASASRRARTCGGPAPIAGAFVYVGESGEIGAAPMPMCVGHACVSAVQKFVLTLPRRPFSDREIDFLVDAGYTMPELMRAGLLPEADLNEKEC